jgi:hypothetical protein
MSAVDPPLGDTVALTASAPRIAGLPVLKGLVLYGAVLTFAGIYIDFIVRISLAGGRPPSFDPVLVSAAAALAGVLGSAFALEIGTPADPKATNPSLKQALAAAAASDSRTVICSARIRQLFSLEPSSTKTSSWPKSFGIWAYAVVGSAVALTYVLNAQQTPNAIKALAVSFGGYVIALVTSAYRSGS